MTILSLLTFMPRIQRVTSDLRKNGTPSSALIYGRNLTEIGMIISNHPPNSKFKIILTGNWAYAALAPGGVDNSIRGCYTSLTRNGDTVRPGQCRTCRPRGWACTRTAVDRPIRFGGRTSSFQGDGSGSGPAI